MYRRSAILLFVLAMLCALASAALAAEITLVDRGLPLVNATNTNINNYPGRDECNVGWAFAWDTYGPPDYSGSSTYAVGYAVGDDFTVPSAAKINTVRVWLTADGVSGGAYQDLNADLNNLALFLGPKDGPLSRVSLGTFTGETGTSTDNPNISITSVTYNNGERYYGADALFNLYQIDFNVSSLNLTYNAGTALSFAVWGDPKDDYGFTFLHCTNAARSNNPHQDGADNLLSAWDIAKAGPTMATFDSVQDVGTWWNYSQDANVQVLGANAFPGDSNYDGKVDINDLSMVLSNYDKTGTGWHGGDFNFDGKVDINDLSLVLSQYDKTGGASLTTVPEPSSLILLTLLLPALGWVIVRCRR